mmetsp:Transcript_22093/g.63268  ORF Transcript_22093/g.63268 Transcript_22093/m.63268 type:complete len:315 (+) Transcript_22093:841-1785(+)
MERQRHSRVDRGGHAQAVPHGLLPGPGLDDPPGHLAEGQGQVARDAINGLGPLVAARRGLGAARVRRARGAADPPRRREERHDRHQGLQGREAAAQHGRQRLGARAARRLDIPPAAALRGVVAGGCARRGADLCAAARQLALWGDVHAPLCPRGVCRVGQEVAGLPRAASHEPQGRHLLAAQGRPLVARGPAARRRVPAELGGMEAAPAAHRRQGHAGPVLRGALQRRRHALRRPGARVREHLRRAAPPLPLRGGLRAPGGRGVARLRPRRETGHRQAVPHVGRQYFQVREQVPGHDATVRLRPAVSRVAPPHA